MGESIWRKQSCLAMFPHWVLCWLFVVTSISQGRDTLEVGNVLRDWEFLESPGKHFQLRFFSPDFTRNRYLGIQFQSVEPYTKFVWVANRDKPLMDTSAVLNLTQDGILNIDYHGTSITINSQQQRINGIRNTILTLLDSGNLVLRVGEEVLWQSFDYPTDTYLPGMKIRLFGLNSKQLRRQSLTSWTSPNAPASGAFTVGVDPKNTKQLVIRRRGAIYWSSGTWNEIGMNFSYFPENLYDDNRYKLIYTSNENESYFTLSMARGDLPAWIAMNSSGSCDLFMGNVNGWSLGSYPRCDTRRQLMSMGCARVQPSKCSEGDEFYLTTGVMDSWEGDGNQTLSISDCKETCRNSCSCNAYTSAEADGTGCMFSSGSKLNETDGLLPELFYFRNATLVEIGPSQTDVMNKSIPSEIPARTDVKEKNHPRKVPLWVFVAVPLVSVTLTVSCILVCYLQGGKARIGGKKGHQEHKESISTYIDDLSSINMLEFSAKNDHELPSFSFSAVQCATNNFSLENKLGQGGFGPVYRGTFDNGQEIAVKRLSRSSGQGIDEFRNEVILISKLQHRNLVRLLGCCIQGEEKLLIYEYMPNKSLDSFLFDATKRLLLDWRKRFSIIEGIAQGLLYLHKYSRLRIIHRDIKTSNILLDAELNPKISDFGLARTFGDNESGGNTKNIAGTRGYMSPEYAMGGLFSVKSDVFGFGVMVLEIISGKKNASLYHCNHFLNLLGYAWDLWKEERAATLMDPGLEETSSTTTEVARCVQIGLLCVQENAADRPTMSDVVSLLNNEMATLPIPEQPAFSTVESTSEGDAAEGKRPCSINDFTISEMGPR